MRIKKSSCSRSKKSNFWVPFTLRTIVMEILTIDSMGWAKKYFEINQVSNISLSIIFSAVWGMKWSLTKSRMIRFAFASYLLWVANFVGSIEATITFSTCSQILASSISICNLNFQGMKLEAPFNLSHSLIPKVNILQIWSTTQGKNQQSNE